MNLCPYCGIEAGSIGAGDEFIDFCSECDQVIEGQTIDDTGNNEECPRCKEVELKLQHATEDDHGLILEEWECDCGYYECRTRREKGYELKTE